MATVTSPLYNEQHAMQCKARWCEGTVYLALPLGQHPLGILPDKDTHHQKNACKSTRGFGSPLPSTGPNRTHAHPGWDWYRGYSDPKRIYRVAHCKTLNLNIRRGQNQKVVCPYGKSIAGSAVTQARTSRRFGTATHRAVHEGPRGARHCHTQGTARGSSSRPLPAPCKWPSVMSENASPDGARDAPLVLASRVRQAT